MQWTWGARANGAAASFTRMRLSIAAAGALALAGCNHDNQTTMSMAQPRGATVAFESIDGPPQGQFNALVKSLNDEAQSRRLAVISRDSRSAYRVRGYLAAKVVKDQTTISWVWDVFDNDEQRALRITGEETAQGRHRDAWTVADAAMLNRIARTSMDQLAAFLTSSEAAPGNATPVAYAGSPESAGIYRTFQAQADPAAVETSDDTGPVPLPRRKPATTAGLSTGETLAFSASRRH